MDRREFIIATSAVATLLPGQTRFRRIGYGRDQDSDEILHEEFALERWNGEKWADTFERRMWWMQGGTRQERTWKLSEIERGFF